MVQPHTYPIDGPDQVQVVRLSGQTEGGNSNIRRKVYTYHTLCT